MRLFVDVLLVNLGKHRWLLRSKRPFRHPYLLKKRRFMLPSLLRWPLEGWTIRRMRVPCWSNFRITTIPFDSVIFG